MHFADLIYAFNHILDLRFYISMLESSLVAEGLTFVGGLLNANSISNDIGIMGE